MTTGTSIRRLLLALALGLLVPASAAPALAADLSAFRGEWQGTAVDADGLDLKPDDLDVALAPTGSGGFTLRWTEIGLQEATVERRTVEAAFRPTDRADVFAFESDGRSLLGRLFASPETGNPLQGETLLWARIEAETLVVYSLSLDSAGGFRLERTARTLDGAGMSLRQTIRTAPDEELVIEGRLQPAGS